MCTFFRRLLGLVAVAGIALASPSTVLSQEAATLAKPAFLDEVQRGSSWRGEQVDAWVVEARNFLSRSRPGDQYREEVFHRLVGMMEWLADGHVSPDVTRRIAEYLEEFPEGQHRDEFRWKQLFWETTFYEFPDQRADLPIQMARKYQRFYDDNPASSVADTVALEIARAWYNAVVMIVDHRDVNSNYHENHVAQFKLRAIKVLEALSIRRGGELSGDAAEILQFLREHEGMSRSGFEKQQDSERLPPARIDEAILIDGELVVLEGVGGRLANGFFATTMTPGQSYVVVDNTTLLVRIKFKYSGDPAGHAHNEGGYNVGFPSGWNDIPSGATVIWTTKKFSGEVTVSFKTPATGQTATALLRLKYTGFQRLTNNGPNWHTFQSSQVFIDRHPDWQWATSWTIGTLQAIFADLDNPNSNSDEVWVNDMSLKWGGRFDINADWGDNTDHQQHRRGYSIDMSKITSVLTSAEFATLVSRYCQVNAILSGSGFPGRGEESAAQGYWSPSVARFSPISS